MKDKKTGWVEADITINGMRLTFAESMALRVAVTSFRMFLASDQTREDLGGIAEGYDLVAGQWHLHLISVEEKLKARQP